MDDRRFVLSDKYTHADTAPITDKLLYPEHEEMFYTEIVEEMNYLNDLAKHLWEENRKLRESNKILRANRKSCEKGRQYERKQWLKMDEMRLEKIKEMHQIVQKEYMKRVMAEKENEWLKKSNETLGKLAYPMQRYIGEWEK